MVMRPNGAGYLFIPEIPIFILVPLRSESYNPKSLYVFPSFTFYTCASDLNWPE